MVRVSESLADLYNTAQETCHSTFICLAYVNHWDWPIRNTLEPLLQSFRHCLKFGETKIACQVIVCWIRYSLFSGESLSYIEKGMIANWKIIKHFDEECDLLHAFTAFSKIISIIKGIDVAQSPARSQLSSQLHSRSLLSPILQHYHLSAEVYTAFWQCNWKECFEITAQSLPFVNEQDLDGFVLLEFPTIRFYSVIAATRMLLENSMIEREAIRFANKKIRKVVAIGTSVEELYIESPLSENGNTMSLPNDRVKLLRKYVKQGRRYFKFLSKLSSQNHIHRVTLIDAEFCNIGNNFTIGMEEDDASELYQIAAKQAQASGFIHEAALSCDLLSQHYSTHLDSLNAQTFYNRSQALYDEWKYGR